MSNAWKIILLPITRLELPGWGRVLSRFGKVDYTHDHIWANEPSRKIRGKWHGYLMTLDMTNWSARLTYFLGRFYELHTQLLLSRLLREGDRFIDIGANIGMLSLHAARLVGKEGIVECYEPNPQCVRTIEGSMRDNGITQVRVFAMGLSDVETVLELKMTHTHTGIGTFGTVDPAQVISAVKVPVKRGSDVFDQALPAPRLIKIDVEGFELRVVRGMRDTLDAWGSGVLMEMHEGHLKRAGASTQELARFMLDLGYTPYDVRVRRRLLRYQLDLKPVHDPAGLAQCRDVYWSREPVV